MCLLDKEQFEKAHSLLFHILCICKIKWGISLTTKTKEKKQT
eukprot:UN23519